MTDLTKTCYLPGYFCPPTEKDLQLAYWLARKTSEVREVVIVIGQEESSQIPAKVNQDIFDIYLRETGGDIVKTVVSTEDSPRHYIYKLVEDSIEEPFILAIPEKVAKSIEFTKKFRRFKNHEIIIIPEYDYSIRQDMIDAVRENNMKDFMSFITPELNKFSVKKIFDMLKESIGGEDNSVIDTKNLQELYKKFGVK